MVYTPYGVAFLAAGILLAGGIPTSSSYELAVELDDPPPLYENLGDYSRAITTVSEEAQAYFDQGLRLGYGFARGDAARSFRAAQREDPDCAMCYWGEAWALGPYQNNPPGIGDAEDARSAAQQALDRSDDAEPWERALIEAMAARYPGTHIAATAVGLMLLCSAPAIAQDPITVEPLTDRHTLTDDVGIQITLTADGLPQEVVELDDASNVAVFEVTVPPGAMFPWHTHPGMSIGKITQGEFVYIYAADCVERSYPAGTAFVDPGFDNVHMAFNPHEEGETVIIATAFGVPADGPYTFPIDEDEAAALDEQCGIEREDPPS